MPNIFNMQMHNLMNKWFSERDAKAITYKSQKRKWTLDWDSYRLNDDGKQYSELTSDQREILRKSKQTWKPAYMYKIERWRAVLANK